MKLRIVCGALLLLVQSLANASQVQFPPITDERANLPGKFIWYDIFTATPQSSLKFYQAVFGWQAIAVEAGNIKYYTFYNGDHPVAGLVQRDSVLQSTSKALWLPSISAASTQKAEKMITASGGKVLMESRDLLGRGEALIARDPSGALFATLQTNGKDPEDFQAEAGDWIWQQLYSHQPTKATAFYQTLFNYNTFEHTLQNKEGVEHYILASQSHARGAIRAMPEAFSQTAKSQWVPFVQVESVAQTLDIAIENGATIVMAPDSDVLDGQLAVLSDPNGAVIGVMTWEYTPQEAK